MGAAEVGRSESITHLVFDLGGVVVELRGLPIHAEWIDGHQTDDDIWRKWLTSSAPRDFESGLTSAGEFARQIVSELQMEVSPEEFLDHFLQLPIGPFPGALEMLHSLKSRYTTALFSNSNELHWQRKMGEMHLGPAFHDHFASHLMGLVKPDGEAFRHVIAELAVDPRAILFLDDNQLNVDAAIAEGMRAERVRGLNEVERCLARHGIQW